MPAMWAYHAEWQLAAGLMKHRCQVIRYEHKRQIVGIKHAKVAYRYTCHFYCTTGTAFVQAARVARLNQQLHRNTSQAKINTRDEALQFQAPDVSHTCPTSKGDRLVASNGSFYQGAIGMYRIMQAPCYTYLHSRIVWTKLVEMGHTQAA
jgi:hypothetical protein